MQVAGWPRYFFLWYMISKSPVSRNKLLNSKGKTYVSLTELGMDKL